MISLFEAPTEPDAEPLMLRFVAKCNDSDPYPLMPSAIPPIHLKKFAEPVRNRNKDWRLESERRILGTQIHTDVGTIRREREAYEENVRNGVMCERPKVPLYPGIYPPGGSSSHENVYSPEAGSVISRERLWRGAVQISRSYCVLTAYGMGISGRVYAAGLHIPRYILLEAYTKEHSTSHQIWVTMDMLETLFKDRPEFLKPGNKLNMIYELCKMLFFEYDVYEQYVNDKSDNGGTQDIEMPPKITKYKHNEPWHTDKVESDSDDDGHSDEEDEEESAERTGATRRARNSMVVKRRDNTTLETLSKSILDEAKQHESPSAPPLRKGKGVVKSMHKKTVEKGPEDLEEKKKSNSGVVPSGEIIPGGRTSVWQKKKTWVVSHLKVSASRKQSAGDLRRLDLLKKREEEARAAEEARRRWFALPKRRRGLFVGRTAHVSGFTVIFMCYEFKEQPGMFLIKLHNMDNCGVYELKISATALGKSFGIKKKPTKWSAEQKNSLLNDFLKTPVDRRHLIRSLGGKLELEVA